MHAPGDWQKDTLIGGDRGMALQKMIQSGPAAAFRMRSLDWLRKLHLVPDEDDVARRCSHGDNIGQADLPRLGDKEIGDSLNAFMIYKQQRRTGSGVGVRVKTTEEGRGGGR